MSAEGQNPHWSEQSHALKTNRPLLLTLWLLKVLPSWLVNALVLPVSLFYYVAASGARRQIKAFQKQLRIFTGGRSPKGIFCAYRTLLSFSLCLVERLSTWLGKIRPECIRFGDDDIGGYFEGLKSGQGALLIASHLGNSDLLRALAAFSSAGVEAEIPVSVLMSLKATRNFTETVRAVNPKYALNAIDPSQIGPATIEDLQNRISRGEIVVLTGDRTGAGENSRVIRLPFLGREAQFPYGIFLIAFLLRAPTYFIFGLREKTYSLFPRNRVFMRRAEIDFDCGRKERGKEIEGLCRDFVTELEKYSILYPNQWYNFFDFWQAQEGQDGIHKG